MTATAEIEVERRDQVLLAPNPALRFEPPERETAPRRGGLAWLFPSKRQFDVSQTLPARDGEAHVWVLRDGRPERVAVETGPSDGSWTEIRGQELAAGDRLVVDAASSRG
jgi:HlyD family secretion protein